VLFLQEKLINLRAIHIEYHTKIDELFALVSDDKIDERTRKLIEFDDKYDTIVVRVKRNIFNAMSSDGQNSTANDITIIKLLRFNGDIGEWVYFRDKFKALITLKASPNYTQRLSYLKSSRMEDAESLQSSNDTLTCIERTI
jgi:hypothetical protein